MSVCLKPEACKAAEVDKIFSGSETLMMAREMFPEILVIFN
jgi:hypothetical protein